MTPEERVRLHDFRVHASSFLGVVACQIALAFYLHVYKPDTRPTWVKRFDKRHGNSLTDTSEARSAQPRINPHTMWTRLDVLDIQASRAKASDTTRRTTDALALEVARMKRQSRDVYLQAKAINLFDKLGTVPE